MASSAARVWITSGFAGLAREQDLRGERALLVGAGREVAVEVKAGLADRHAAGMGGERAQFGQVGVVEAPRFVRMHADGRIHMWKRLGRRERRARGDAVGADREHARDTDGFRRGHQLGVRRLAEVEMCVGIDHSGKNLFWETRPRV